MDDTTARHGLSTMAVHGGRAEPVAETPVVPGIIQGVNFVQPFGTAERLRYPRYGNHPNAESLQKKLALIEGAESALVLGSGQGATACALLALLRPGDHLAASSWLYGGTHRLLLQEFEAFGIRVTLVNPDQPRAWRKAVKKHTRAIFVETPVNPTCRVIDLRAVTHLAHENGIALVVDSTFASPVNFRPMEHGADVVIHSATKYLNGHHDVLAGAVLGTASYIEEVRNKMMVWGQAPDPFACWLLERGLKTLEIRIQRQNETAMRLAQWCESHPAVSRVHYPGLPSHGDHEIAKRQQSGFGGMLAIELAGGAEAADRAVRALRVFTHAPSLGGVDSLVSEPRFTSHAHLSAEDRARAGIPDGFLRLSVGVENGDDLVADLEQALQDQG